MSVNVSSFSLELLSTCQPNVLKAFLGEEDISFSIEMKDQSNVRRDNREMAKRIVNSMQCGQFYSNFTLI